MPKVALDAGHGVDTYYQKGGKGVVDKGGDVFHEHTFNANVVGHLKELLEFNDIQVVLTQPLHRKEVSLKKRTDLANSENVDLFWSVHANASDNPSVRGVCCFYWHNSSDGKRLANLFAKNMKSRGIPLHGDGVHASKVGTWTDLHVIRETKMVALLTENGFMTNNKDLELLQSEAYQRKVAKIHAETISEYFHWPFEDPEEETLPENPDWKMEAINWMYEEGLLTSDEWKKSINEPLPLWAEAIVLKRFMEKLKRDK